MASIVKLTHAPIAEQKDPKEEISKFLLNYRNTPHATTGATPSKLMMGRIIRTKLPSLHQVPNTEEHQLVKQKDAEAKRKQKKYADKHRRAKDKKVQVGDKVLLKQDKTTIHPPFDPEPFEVTTVQGTKVEAERNGKKRTRNLGKWKLLKPRPAYLHKSQNMLKTHKEDIEDSDDESYISVQSMPDHTTEPDIEKLLDRVDLPAVQPPTAPAVPPQPAPPPPIHPSEGAQSPHPTPTHRPKRSSKPIQRLGYEQQAGPSGSNSVKQLSPRERKKRKGAARRLVRRDSKERWVMEPGAWYQSPKGWVKKGVDD